MKPKFDTPPGGNRYKNQTIMAYHVYIPPSINATQTITSRVRDANNMGVPSFCTEFIGGNAEMLSNFDKFGESWLFWNYKLFGKAWGATSNL